MISSSAFETLKLFFFLNSVQVWAILLNKPCLKIMGLSFIQLDLGSPAGYAKFLDLPSVASFYSHTTSFSNYINWVLLFLFLCLFAYVNIHFQILLCVLEFGYKQIHFTPCTHYCVHWDCCFLFVSQCRVSLNKCCCAYKIMFFFPWISHEHLIVIASAYVSC